MMERIGCPSCAGMMELQNLDGREVYKCFVCGRVEAVVSRLDAQRLWGRFHLPLVDVLIHPAGAFHQLNENPAVIANLVFFLFVSLAQWHFSGDRADALTQRLAAYYPVLAQPFAAPLFRAIILLFKDSIEALGLYLGVIAISKGVSGSDRVTLKGLWSIRIFLAGYFGLLQLLPLPREYLYWGIISLNWFWLVGALNALYHFNLWEIAGAALVGWIMKRLLYLLIGLAGVLGGLKISHFAEGTPQGLQAVNYSWVVQGLDRKPLNLESLKGKVLFIHFWATWCPPCIDEMDAIQRLYDRLRNTNPDIRFVCIVPAFLARSEPGVIWEFVKKRRYTVPIFTMSTWPPPPPMEKANILTTYIVSRNGKIDMSIDKEVKWDAPRFAYYLSQLAS